MKRLAQAGVLLALTLSISGAVDGQAVSLAKPPEDTSSAFYHFKQSQYFERQGDWNKAEAELRQTLALAPDDYLAHVKLAALLAQSGKPNEAISLYKRALTLDSKDPMIQFSLGAVYEQTGQYELAEQEYRHGLARNPLYRFGLYNLARVQMQQAKYDEAQASLTQFLADYPDHYAARKYLANVYLVNRQEALAAQEYEALKTRFPDKFDDSLNYARALTRSEAPLKALEELKVAYSQEGNKADILEEMGNAHMALGQAAYAVHNYRKSYDIDNKRYPLLLKIADIQQNLKQPEQTITSLNQYLTHAPEDAGARHWLATTHIGQRNYEASLKELHQLLKAAEDPARRYELEKETAYVYQLKGDMAQAISRYERLIHQSEAVKDTQLKNNLALAYHQAGRLEDAIPLYKSVYAQLPETTPEEQKARRVLANDLSNALVALGDRAYQTRQYDEALLKYTEASRYAAPDNIAPYLGLGNSYFALSLYDQADIAYQQVLAINPTHADARLYQAKLKLHQQEPGASVHILQRLAAEQPDSTEVLLALGDAYAASGKARQAIQIFEKAQAQSSLTSPLTGLSGNPSGSSLDALAGVPEGLASGSSQAIGGQPAGLQPTQREALLMTLGTLYQQLGEYENAKATYQKLLTMAPPVSTAMQAKAYYNLGIVYNELGQLNESAQAYQQALILDPMFADAHYGLAITLEKQQRYPDALRAYEVYAQQSNPQYLPQAQERIQLIKQALEPREPIVTPAPATQTPGSIPTFKPVTPSDQPAATTSATPSPGQTTQVQ